MLLGQGGSGPYNAAASENNEEIKSKTSHLAEVYRSVDLLVNKSRVVALKSMAHPALNLLGECANLLRARGKNELKDIWNQKNRQLAVESLVKGGNHVEMSR